MLDVKGNGRAVQCDNIYRVKIETRLLFHIMLFTTISLSFGQRFVFSHTAQMRVQKFA